MLTACYGFRVGILLLLLLDDSQQCILEVRRTGGVIIQYLDELLHGVLGRPYRGLDLLHAAAAGDTTLLQQEVETGGLCRRVSHFLVSYNIVLDA